MRVHFDTFWLSPGCLILPLSVSLEASDTCVAAASPTLDDAMAKTGDLCPNFLGKALHHFTSPEPKPRVSNVAPSKSLFANEKPIAEDLS